MFLVHITIFEFRLGIEIYPLKVYSSQVVLCGKKKTDKKHNMSPYRVVSSKETTS